MGVPPIPISHFAGCRHGELVRRRPDVRRRRPRVGRRALGPLVAARRKQRARQDAACTGGLCGASFRLASGRVRRDDPSDRYVVQDGGPARACHFSTIATDPISQASPRSLAVCREQCAASGQGVRPSRRSGSAEQREAVVTR